jgi:hypothetical protein
MTISLPSRETTSSQAVPVLTRSRPEKVPISSMGDGRDVIFAGAGDDQVFGGGHADVIYARPEPIASSAMQATT